MAFLDRLVEIEGFASVGKRSWSKVACLAFSQPLSTRKMFGICTVTSARIIAQEANSTDSSFEAPPMSLFE